VSTLFIDDEILFCANEQSETSKRSFPDSLLFLGLSIPASPHARTLFPLFYVVTTFGQRTLTKADEKGGDSGRRQREAEKEKEKSQDKDKIKRGESGGGADIVVVVILVVVVGRHFPSLGERKVGHLGEKSVKAWNAKVKRRRGAGWTQGGWRGRVPLMLIYFRWWFA